MSYELRSYDEMIFECETAEEFQCRLKELGEQVRRGEFDYSDLNGSWWMKTHESDGSNSLKETKAYQQLQDELRQGREAVEKLEYVAGQLSDVWLLLDEWARSSHMPPLIRNVCRDILTEQKAPGWKKGE